MTFKSPEFWLEIIKVVFSASLLGFIFALIFISKFYDSIKKFLSEKKIDKVGPLGLGDRQMESLIRTEEEDSKKENIEDMMGKLKNLEEEADKKDATIKEKDDYINLLQQVNEFNEFSYLNLFFVPTTKSVLLWVNNNGITTKDLYSLQYQTLIPDPLQRETIWSVLLNNGVLDLVSGNSYKTSDKGIRFLKFIGYLK